MAQLQSHGACDAEAFARDPKLVWEWYQWRRAEAMKAKPNAAHLALAQLANRSPECLIVTQNVDDLHERADTPAHKLVHVHGNLFSNRCQACDYCDTAAIHDRDIPNAQNAGRDCFDPASFGLAKVWILLCSGASTVSCMPATARSHL